MNSSRIGFACVYMHPDQSKNKSELNQIQKPYRCRSTTLSWLNKQTREDAEQKMFEIVSHNLDSLCKLVGTVASFPLVQRMVRLGSDVLPMYTHPDWYSFYQEPVITSLMARRFAEVGSIAHRNSVRLSFHPGQYTVLASDRTEVVDNAILDIEYHATMARLMGYGRHFQDFKINIHLSGKRGVVGFREGYQKLSPEARRMLTVENTEFGATLEDCLQLTKTLPIVFDIHHYWVASGEYLNPSDDKFQRIIESWRGIRPVVHYSLPREQFSSFCLPDQKPDLTILESQGIKRQALRAHSDFYWNHACNEYASNFLPVADIMCEAKMKNLASEKFANLFVD